MTPPMPPIPRLFNFAANGTGPWRVEQMHCLAGQPLAATPALSVLVGSTVPASLSGVCNNTWQLRGITSNERYVRRTEKAELVAKQEGLGRKNSTCAALIPIRKNAAWWALTQDERREVLEAQSQHIAIGMRHLPAIARRLHHCRDLGPDEPFDFITWFEYAPEDASRFNELLYSLRATPEWTYVDREVDIRLVSSKV